MHLGSALTGVGTTLLGCILPSLTMAWHLNDSRAGILFAAQFSGSALGALLVGTNFFSSIVRGYLLLIASAVGIVFFANVFSWLSFFCFGLGLGLTMTATTMLVSRAFVGHRGAALSLLNASWATGAVLCPAIASSWTARWSSVSLFLVFASVAGATLVLIFRDAKNLSIIGASVEQSGDSTNQIKLALVFVVLAFLYLGVEASVGGWMMTYVRRLLLSSRSWAPVTTSFFWISLLAGRTIAPGILRVVSEAKLLAVTIVIAFASVVILVLSYKPAPVLLSAAFVGLALGPIYPLCLAGALAAMKDSPNAKWIFAIAGFGSAALPWMTGKVSAANGSLRTGLIVPACALGAMSVIYGVRLSRNVFAAPKSTAIMRTSL